MPLQGAEGHSVNGGPGVEQCTVCVAVSSSSDYVINPLIKKINCKIRNTKNNESGPKKY